MAGEPGAVVGRQGDRQGQGLSRDTSGDKLAGLSVSKAYRKEGDVEMSSWQTPKTNWGRPGQTVPVADDFNRIEGNIQHLQDTKETPAGAQAKAEAAAAAAVAAHNTNVAAHGGIYRKNLLLNWDFRNLVNQRGQTEYTNLEGVGGYTIDRWRLSGSGIVRIKNGSIELESLGTDRLYFTQTIENPRLYDGKTVTVSAEINGQIYSATGVINLSRGINPLFATITLSEGYVEMEYVTDAQLLRFRIVVSIGRKISNITRVKLEFGSISTLANDPPADYGEQLMLCKRFFRLWTTEAARTEALKEVGLMRIPNPTLGTISIGGTTYYYASAEA